MAVQSGLKKTLQTIWIDPGLFAQVKVYDNTTGARTLVATLPMTEVETGVYEATFTPNANTSYCTTARVYTDGTYATRDTNYAPAGEDFEGINFAAGGGGSVIVVQGELVATVQPAQPLVALLTPSHALVALITPVPQLVALASC
jgi:hypothetical protein